MIRKPAAMVLCAAVLIAGCGRELTSQQAVSLVPEAKQLLRQHPGERELGSTQWPASVAVLRPEAVQVRPEGLYIRMSSFFVTERGYFVPASDKATFGEDGDPSYRPLAQGVYAYRIEG